MADERNSMVIVFDTCRSELCKTSGPLTFDLRMDNLVLGVQVGELVAVVTLRDALDTFVPV